MNIHVATSSRHDGTAEADTSRSKLMLLGVTRAPNYRMVGAKTFRILNGELQQRKPFYPRYYDSHRTVEVGTFDDLVDLCGALLQAPNWHVTLGRLRPDADLSKISRKFVTSGGDILDAQTNVLILDVDGLLLEHAVDPAVDPQGAAQAAYDAVVSVMPELDGVRSVVVFSASAGMREFGVEDGGKRTIRTVRAHLCFLLDEPVFPHQMRDRVSYANHRSRVELVGMTTGKLMNEGIYMPGHPIFMSEPIFRAGTKNPLPDGRRMVVIEGSRDSTSLDTSAKNTIAAWQVGDVTAYGGKAKKLNQATKANRQFNVLSEPQVLRQLAALPTMTLEKRGPYGIEGVVFSVAAVCAASEYIGLPRWREVAGGWLMSTGRFDEGYVMDILNDVEDEAVSASLKPDEDAPRISGLKPLEYFWRITEWGERKISVGATSLPDVSNPVLWHYIQNSPFRLPDYYEPPLKRGSAEQVYDSVAAAVVRVGQGAEAFRLQERANKYVTTIETLRHIKSGKADADDFDRFNALCHRRHDTGRFVTVTDPEFIEKVERRLERLTMRQNKSTGRPFARDPRKHLFEIILDDALHYNTLISGPTGSRKSTLALRMLFDNPFIRLQAITHNIGLARSMMADALEYFAKWAEEAGLPDQSHRLYLRGGGGAPDLRKHPVDQPIPDDFTPNCSRQADVEAHCGNGGSLKDVCGSKKSGFCPDHGTCGLHFQMADPKLQKAQIVITAGTMAYERPKSVRYRDDGTVMQWIDDISGGDLFEVRSYSLSDFEIADKDPGGGIIDGSSLREVAKAFRTMMGNVDLGRRTFTPDEVGGWIGVDGLAAGAVGALRRDISEYIEEAEALWGYMGHDAATEQGAALKEAYERFSVLSALRSARDQAFAAIMKAAEFPNGARPSVPGFLTGGKARKIGEHNAQMHKLAKLFGDAVNFIEHEGRSSLHIEKSGNGRKMTVYRLMQRKLRCPLLITDATAPAELWEYITGGHVETQEFLQIEGGGNVFTDQLVNTVAGKMQMAPQVDEDGNLVLSQKTERRLGEVETAVLWNAAYSPLADTERGGLLFMSFKDTVEEFTSRPQLYGVNYHALSLSQGRGRNGYYKTCNRQIIVGRPATPEYVHIAKAAAVKRTSLPLEKYARRTGVYYMVDGTVEPAPDQEYLSDPLAELFRQQDVVAPVGQGPRLRQHLRDGERIEYTIGTSVSQPWLPARRLITLDQMLENGSHVHRLLLEVVPEADVRKFVGVMLGIGDGALRERLSANRAQADALDSLVARAKAGQLGPHFNRWSLAALGGRWQVNIRGPEGDVAYAEAALRRLLAIFGAKEAETTPLELVALQRLPEAPVVVVDTSWECPPDVLEMLGKYRRVGELGIFPKPVGGDWVAVVAGICGEDFFKVRLDTMQGGHNNPIRAALSLMTQDEGCFTHRVLMDSGVPQYPDESDVRVMTSAGVKALEVLPGTRVIALERVEPRRRGRPMKPGQG